LSLTTAKGTDFAMSLPVIPIVALALQHPPSWYLALLPLAMAIQWVLVAGVTLALSALGAVFGDVERAIRVAMRAMFYTTPVIYPFDRIPSETFATALEILNPMVGLIRIYRAAWFAESFPGWWVVGWSAAYALIILATGWKVFARMERLVLKEL
jgi:ABC-2 type transport system permease protein